jgi:hypothetical protein
MASPHEENVLFLNRREDGQRQQVIRPRDAIVERTLEHLAVLPFDLEPTELEIRLRRGLDWLARIAPYDLATIFVLEDGRLRVRTAQGPVADERVAG